MTCLSNYLLIMDAQTISRRSARRDAMVILYQHDLTGAGLKELYNNHEQENGYYPAEFTREEVEGVLSFKEELDGSIDTYSKGWPAHRLAALERSILRIGLYEIEKRGDIPMEASIDEAVQLAKRYCSREAAVLINGVLGKVADELKSGE